MKPPFAALNLTRNPFGSLQPAEQAATASVDLGPILVALETGCSVQLLGRCGRGKSTHLYRLEATLPHAVYRRVRNHDRWPTVPPVPPRCPLLLLDEADALWFGARIRVLRAARQVVLATHRPLTWSLRIAGHRSVVIPVSQPLDPRWLADAIRRRVEYFRRAEGPVPLPSLELIEQLIADHGDDLRSIEGELYDLYQRLTLPSASQ